MADFSSSSSPYESEVDQILAEAMDHRVLEQISAINCSSFSHSLLPSHLETRFQNLKTFSFSTTSKPQLAPDSANESKSEYQISPKINGNSSDKDDKVEKLPSGQSKVSNFEGNSDDVGEGKMGNSPNGQLKFPNFEGGSGGRKGKKGNSKGGYISSPSDSSSGYMDSPNLKGGKHSVKGKIGNSKPRSVSICSDSEEETTAKSGGGCLCFSPKRVSSKKKKGGGELGFSWGKDEELLSDLRSFSSKEQKRRMKEAMKEEEMINKEAEKIVKWAKQVSARMDFDISDDDDDDDDVGDHSGHPYHSCRR